MNGLIQQSERINNIKILIERWRLRRIMNRMFELNPYILVCVLSVNTHATDSDLNVTFDRTQSKLITRPVILK
jgi:hypothetical protein